MSPAITRPHDLAREGRRRCLFSDSRFYGLQKSKKAFHEGAERAAPHPTLSRREREKSSNCNKVCKGATIPLPTGGDEGEGVCYHQKLPSCCATPSIAPIGQRYNLRESFARMKHPVKKFFGISSKQDDFMDSNFDGKCLSVRTSLIFFVSRRDASLRSMETRIMQQVHNKEMQSEKNIYVHRGFQCCDLGMPIHVNRWTLFYRPSESV